eukprot:SAG22_NODE_18648_length_283_cov_1.130435_1_plen_81_part_01
MARALLTRKYHPQVPGSHRWRFSAGDEYYKGQFSGVREDGTSKMTEMPGYRKVSCKAGTSMIFDLRTWHAAGANTSELERR